MKKARLSRRNNGILGGRLNDSHIEGMERAIRMKPAQRRLWLAASLVAGILLLGLLFWRRRKPEKTPQTSSRTKPGGLEAAPPRIRGLSESEVAARLPDFDMDAEIKIEQARFRNQAICQSLFNTFNIDLFGIALVLLILGSPDGALGTMLLVAINLIINVYQQMYTKRKLDQIIKELRPQAAVVRDGRLRSIDPAFIVKGDYLIIGPGDQFLVNGVLASKNPIEVEEAKDSNQIEQKADGDFVAAGGFCTAGRGFYIASEDGIDRYRTAPGRELQLLIGKRTFLQRFMEMVLRALFGLVLVFGILLVLDAVIQNAEIVSSAYRDAFSIVFGIAPTSLFFILIITYVIGTLRISEHGGLVYQAQSIETLANVTTLCISKESVVGELQVHLDPIEPPEGYTGLSETLARHILGAIVHSEPPINKMSEMMADALPGEKMRVKQVAPFLFEAGWYGIVFDEPEFSGVYVIGLPEVIEGSFVREKTEIVESVEETLVQAQRGLGRWLRRFRRKEDGVALQPKDQSGLLGVDSSLENLPETTQPDGAQSSPESRPIRERLLDRLERLLSPMEDLEMLDAEPEKPEHEIHFMFAYRPTAVNLYNRRGEAGVPAGLIPIANLYIRESLRPEAGQTIQALAEDGLKIKILSGESASQAANTARQLGFSKGVVPMVDAEDLFALDAADFARGTAENLIFGNLSPGQKAAIVKSLQDQGERVLMVGSQVGDTPAMRQADLRVALKSSAQAALRLTDVVLLDDSLAALPYAVATGQRLVNGVLATFKLYLSHVISQLLLILAMIFIGFNSFPYHPTQAGVISAFTIAVPNALLSVWAAGGRVSGGAIRRQLARFIIPTAITLALLSLAIHWIFLTRTGSEEYAELAVTTALLMAGWLRIFFVQPPTRFWEGAVPLRGDRRVIGLVFGSIALTLLVLSIPLLRELLRMDWLMSLADYGLVALVVVIWALTLRAIWRSGWLEPLIKKIGMPDTL